MKIQKMEKNLTTTTLALTNPSSYNTLTKSKEKLSWTMDTQFFNK